MGSLVVYDHSISRFEQVIWWLVFDHSNGLFEQSIWWLVFDNCNMPGMGYMVLAAAWSCVRTAAVVGS